MDKKGYIRTLEAVIAIVIILTFTYSVMPKKAVDPHAVPYAVETAQKTILKEIQNNYRDAILNEPITALETEVDLPSNIETDVIGKYKPPGYNHKAKICTKTVCKIDAITKKSVYMDDVLISSTMTKQEPRIVRIWFWPK